MQSTGVPAKWVHVYYSPRMYVVMFNSITSSGTSTFYADRFLHTHVRMNLVMRNTRHWGEVPFDCLIDNVTTTREGRRHYIPMATKAGAVVTRDYFEIAPEEAFERNAQGARDMEIPKQAILGMQKKSLPPHYDEATTHSIPRAWSEGHSKSRKCRSRPVVPSAMPQS